ncbi:MAG: hypothetical protein AB7O24_28025, partial [Kofleriaceae bacterium]
VVVTDRLFAVSMAPADLAARHRRQSSAARPRPIYTDCGDAAKSDRTVDDDPSPHIVLMVLMTNGSW